MRRNWTNEEIEYLFANWGCITVDTLSKKLNRSVCGIKTKAYKLGLDNFANSLDYVSLNILLSSLGYCRCNKFIRENLYKYNCPIIKKKISSKKIIPYVKIDDFWKWAEENKSILNFSRFDRGILGKEPDWVNEKRQIDSISITKKSQRKWSNYEDNLLISKLSLFKYTYTDIAVELNRSEAAVKARIRTLGLKVRPLPRSNVHWSKEQCELLQSLYSQGYDIPYISRKINKSELSVYDKLSRIGC